MINMEVNFKKDLNILGENVTEDYIKILSKSALKRKLILEIVSHLDAFSDYLV